MTALPHRLFACLALAALLVSPLARAGTFAELESSYLGDGWFRYTLTMYDNEFTRFDWIYRIGSTLFTNRLEFGSVPANWVDGSLTAHDVFWDYTAPSNSQVPVYTGEFYVHSSEQGFRTTNTFWIAYRVWPELWLGWEQGAWGFSVVPCLVPCPPAQSDGSPSNLVASCEYVPDVEIHALTTNTLSFSWGTEYTVLIAGSSNLQTWTGITNALGYPGTNTWTSAVPLSTYGRAFRVGLIATSHQTNW